MEGPSHGAPIWSASPMQLPDMRSAVRLGSIAGGREGEAHPTTAQWRATRLPYSLPTQESTLGRTGPILFMGPSPRSSSHPRIHTSPAPF